MYSTITKKTQYNQNNSRNDNDNNNNISELVKQTIVSSPSTLKSNITYAMAVTNTSKDKNKIKLQNLAKPTETVHANPDSACTGHFFGRDFAGKEIAHKPISVICANNSEITSTKTKELNIEEFPQEARKCHICPDIKKQEPTVGPSTM